MLSLYPLSFHPLPHSLAPATLPTPLPSIASALFPKNNRGGTYERFVGILTAASCGALRGGRWPAGGELHQAVDRVAQDQKRQRPGGVFAIGGNRGDEKQNGSGEGDAGGPGIAPRAVGAVHLRFALAQNKKRRVGERVIRDEEKRKHGNDALEGAEDKSDSRDGAEQQGNR